MKWYPLAHLAAVTMSCFYAELQALQMLCPTSATGIARAFPSFLLYMHIFQFPDSRYRPQVSLSDNLKPFQRCRGGKHKANLGGLALRHRQRPPTYRDPFLPRSCQKVTEKTDTAFTTLAGAQKNTSTCIHSQVLSSLAAHLAVRPPLPVAPHYDFWPSRVNI